MSRPGDREGERAFAKAEVVSITVTGKAGAAAPVTTNVKFADGAANGAEIGFSGASVDTSNDLNIMYNLTAPKWIGASATATVEAQITINGVPAATATTTTSAVSGGVLAGTKAAAVSNVPSGAKVEVVITEITYSHVAIQYLNHSGEDITGKMTAAGSEDEAAVASGASAAVEYSTTDQTNKPSFTLTSGAVAGTVGSVTYVTDSWNATITGLQAKGDAAVVITVDDSAVEPTFALALDGTNVKSGSDANTLSDWGVTGATDGAQKATVTLSSNAGALKPTDNATLTITNKTALVDAFEYTATVTLDSGATYTKDYNGTANGATVFTISGIQADTKVTGVELAVKTPKLAVTKAEFGAGNTKLTLTFNAAINPATAIAGNFGLTNVTAGATTTVEMSGEDTIVISVVGGSFSGAVTMTAGAVQSKAAAANTAVGGSWTPAP